MTLSTHRLSKVLRNLFGSWRVSPLEGGRPRTGTVPRPSADVPQPAPGPLSTPATLRKPEAGSGEPTAREDAEEAWTAKTCPIHQTGDLIEGRYEVQERFEGAMGYVYIARDSTQDLTFAIKQPKEQMLANRDIYARVLREADAWTGLGMHPHIAYCYFVKNLEEVPHIFVEYVDGGNLREWISEGRCPDERSRLELAIQFCHGMEHAHGRGMIHRDIKPENILVSRDGTVKFTDFGLVGEAAGRAVVAPTGGKTTGTRFGDLMGTPAYMAPEQLADPRRRSAEVPDGVWADSDVYSFGVCLWELFCGGRPEQFESTGAEAIRGARPDLPAGLGELLLATVAKDRTQRPPDFTTLRERLNGIYRELFEEDAPSYRIEVPERAADELNNQGYSYFELGKPEDARACFERAREIEPTHPQATYNFSLLQWRAGEIDDLEVLRRLENCRTNPAVDTQALAELTAYIHAERFAPDLAREVLKEYPGRYEALFGEVEIEEIRCMRTLDAHDGDVIAVALSEDGQRALLSCDDMTLTLWDLSTGVRPLALKGHTDLVVAVAFGPDGKRAFSGSRDKTLNLWDAETGACLHTLRGSTEFAIAVAFSADGLQLLSAGWNNTVNLWDPATGACLRTLKGPVKDATALALSTDGRRALSGGKNGQVKLWNLDSGECQRIMERHTAEILAVALGAASHRALSCSRDYSVKLWDLDTGKCARTLDGMRFVECLALSADGRRGLCGSEDGTAWLWKLPRRAPWQARLHLAVPKVVEARQVEQRLIEEAAGRAEAFMSRGDYRSAYNGFFFAWRAVSFRESGPASSVYTQLLRRGLPSRPVLVYQDKMLEGHTDWVQAVDLRADGRRALSAGSWEDRTLKLWDLETGVCLCALVGHTDSVAAVAIAPDGSWGLSGSDDRTLRLWDLKTGTCIRTLEGHTGGVNALALSADGRQALSGSRDATLKLWDLETGECLRTLGGYASEVNAVALGAEGRRALSGSDDKNVKLWDLQTGSCLRTLEGHTGQIQAVELSPDGRRALTGGWDNIIRLWDLETGVCLRTLEGHTGAVMAMTLIAGERCVVSASYDQTLRFWDLETGDCRNVMKSHARGVSSVAVSNDSQWVVTGGGDRTVRIWRIIWELEFPAEA